jgi:anti-sigma factor RsiW
MSSACENLDAFLGGELLPAGDERFKAHLDECDACRDAVDQQRWIDELLRSPLAAQFESPSQDLTVSLRAPGGRRARYARAVACGLAAAAALVVAVGWAAMLNRQARAPAVNRMAKAATPNTPGPELPRAVFVGGPEVLVVPIASRHPNVTIVRIYPTYQPSYDAQANAEPFEPDHFNGG